MPPKTIVGLEGLLETDPLDVVVSETPAIFQKGSKVPNKNPTIQAAYRIAVIGEAPGRDEEIQGIPFVGMSGRLLNGLLSKANILRDACFVGNICQYRPPNNDISFFDYNGPEITEGLEQLHKDLNDFNPNICILLGKTALFAAKGVHNIGDWRGSLFVGEKAGPFLGRKCIAAYHPAACLRQYEWTALLLFDILKAYKEAQSPNLILPIRDLRIDVSVDIIIDEINKIEQNNLTISPDIEGGLGTMYCISIATSGNYSFIIPFANLDRSSYWTDLEDELKIWQAFVRMMANPNVKKIWQNGLYDRFVLQYGYSVICHGNSDDTMLEFWEMWCELEKSLGFQCSILGKEPYYKFERKLDNREAHFKYCCKDSACTFENKLALDRLLPPMAKHHYEFNNELLNPMLYMEIRGILYDTKKAKERLKEVKSHIYSLQAQLDELAGAGWSGSNLPREEMAKGVSEALCYKKDATKPKKGNEEAYLHCVRILMGEAVLTNEQIGELNIHCNLSMNIKSPIFKTFLYETLNLPKQYVRDQNGKEHLSVNYESLLKIQKKQPHKAVEVALQLGELRTRAQMLEIHSDQDGRIRCGYNIVGTETGRLTCYTSPTGSGYNLQTIPAEATSKSDSDPLRKGMRDLFIADEGCYLFQCDLSGADGWTVAAHLANLGDPTMLDDYRAGIKPAKVLCYLLRNGANSLTGRDRQSIKELTKSIEKDSWDYFASKIGQHGTCYLMGPQKLANQIFIQSEGKINLSSNETKELQKLFMIRYNVTIWHNWMKRKIEKSFGPPILTAASGHTRKFFGRKTEILGEMLAHEPQDNTTYAIKLAVYKLWSDPENRRGIRLRNEPLHTVHDSLLGQFKIEDTTWAVDKVKSYFDNAITIAGQRIVIPYEGTYGTDWAFDEHSKVGNI